MKLGNASSVYLNFSIAEAIRRVALAGYDGIDIWGGRPHVYRQDFTQAELKALRRLVEDNGLEVISFMPAFFRYPHSLSNPNPKVRQDSLDYMRECIDNAVALGADLLLVIPGHSLYGQSAEDVWNLMAEAVDEIYDYSIQYDLRLAIEPANRFVTDFMNTASDALRMLQQLGHEDIGVTMDTGHMNLLEETIEEVVEKLGSRLYQVHVNDNDGRNQQNLIPGDGTYDFERMVTALHDSGFAGYLSVELGWHYTFEPDQPVREAVRRMREHLQNSANLKARP